MFFIFFVGTLVSLSNSYRLLELPDIKASSWMGSSILEEDPTWETNFDELSQEAFNILDRGSVYVASQHISGLNIVCNASYPVEWTFAQAEYADEDTYNIVMKTSRESNDVNNPLNDRFIALLDIFGDANAATGNYTCRSIAPIGGRKLEKSIFVYWEGSSPPYLILSRKTMHVQSVDNKTIVLPCYVSHPDVDVQLFKEISGTFQPAISGGRGVKFDPKIGYVFDLRKMSDPNVYGRYKCVADGDDDILNIIVETGMSPSRQFQNIISPGTGLYYDPEKEEIVCCARGNRPPSLHNLFCLNPSVCKMLEHKLYQVGNNGKKLINGSCISDKVYPRDHGILRCKGDGIDVFRPIYTDFSKLENKPLGLYFGWKEIIPEKMMRLTVKDTPPYFHLQTISASCEGMNSYFSDGHKWAIRWRNKTLSFFDPIEYVDDPHIHGMRNVEIDLNYKMAELICYAPVWNSTSWGSKTIKLDVHRSSRPVIEGPPIEETFLILNDTEKLIECKSRANPPATLIWKKNGLDVPKDMIIWKENGTSILLFHRVSHETQADYICRAKNFAGQAEKIIRVFVEDSGSAWGTAAAVIIPILGIAFIITAGFLFWKMQIQKKIVDHLTRVVFRDNERQAQNSGDST